MDDEITLGGQPLVDDGLRMVDPGTGEEVEVLEPADAPYQLSS